MTAPDGYSSDDVARLGSEEPKAAWFAAEDRSGVDARTPFARDRARVLHSAALRRLAGKTQVVGPEEDDVPRTRLTHSLEVAQIGRGIADALGADPDVVDMAGLAHDIGHPPFGHNGERALDELLPVPDGFEGNAQTLRILARLEPKWSAADSERGGSGLNLTRACLDAVLKYPWPRPDGARRRAKFGVYTADRAVFDWVRAPAPPGRRCLEAQIMDWADDVAYSVHDLEDGVLAGRISLRSLSSPVERAEIVRIAADLDAGSSAGQVGEGTLTAAVERLAALPAVRAVTGCSDAFAEHTALKRLTSELVGRFVGAAVRSTRERFAERRLTRYAAELVVPAPVVAEVAVLKAFAFRYVLRTQERARMQAEQRQLLAELARKVARRAPRDLDPVLRDVWDAARDDAECWRVVADQVASLTDAQAVRWHRQLVGEAADSA
ncbi:deoxyguanosinetriphosphate triphosphohydrolase [Salinifilum aidingensis]